MELEKKVDIAKSCITSDEIAHLDRLLGILGRFGDGRCDMEFFSNGEDNFEDAVIARGNFFGMCSCVLVSFP